MKHGRTDDNKYRIEGLRKTERRIRKSTVHLVGFTEGNDQGKEKN